MLSDARHLATDGSLLLAIPAFAPAVVIAGVVIFLALRNRRQAADDPDVESEL